jgi:post-segregation antitoxin (ccd killing protein)
MTRVQVQLKPEQHREVKRRAKRLGVSVAEVVRRCLDAQLQATAPDGRQDRIRRAMTVVGKYTDPSGATTVARDHDRHLAEAYRR